MRSPSAYSILAAMMVFIGFGYVQAATRHVNVNNSTPAAPYTSWATAATSIQAAVDVAQTGDLILVTDGVYETGGRAVYGTMTNRVSVTNAITLHSVNGSSVTVIKGYQMPGSTNGSSAVRCVYLAEGAVLDGFSLTNGATHETGDLSHEQSGGGIWCASLNVSVSNCVIVGNAAVYGGGAYSGTLNNCILTTNSAALGGGVAYSAARECVFTGNSAGEGGAAYDSTVENCALTRNSANLGGGTSYTTATNCVFTANRASNHGGGSFHGTLLGCMLGGNIASGGGGGAYGSSLYGCFLTTNSANAGGGADYASANNCLFTRNTAYYGGGAELSSLSSCTVINNTGIIGGGAYYGYVNNSIIYYNSAVADDNYYQGTFGGAFNYCCTTPMPTIGFGNITNAPLIVDPFGGDLQLQPNSPCINAGWNQYLLSTDYAGNPRVQGGMVDIGAYEFQSPASTLSYAWALWYNVATDGTQDNLDPDADGMSNFQESRAGTDPTNALSLLKMFPPVIIQNPRRVVLTWQSTRGKVYTVHQSGLNYGNPPFFSPIRSEIDGKSGTTSITNSIPANSSQSFYRVSVD